MTLLSGSMMQSSIMSSINNSCSVFGHNVAAHNDSSQLDVLDIKVRIAISILLIAVGIVGTFGNLLSIILLVKNKHLQTYPNFYIGHTGVVDLITCLVTIPASVYQTLGGDNSTQSILSERWCKIFGL